MSNLAGAVVITFADDRVERWTAVDKRMVVEHWCPASAYPAGEKVMGIADRVQQSGRGRAAVAARGRPLAAGAAVISSRA